MCGESGLLRKSEDNEVVEGYKGVGRNVKGGDASEQFCVFFFSSRRRHTRWTGDWSSDCALPIVAGVRADGHMVLFGQQQRPAHDERIARMGATGDIDRGHQWNECVIISHRPVPEGLACVAIEVDFMDRPFMCHRYSPFAVSGSGSHRRSTLQTQRVVASAMVGAQSARCHRHAVAML